MKILFLNNEGAGFAELGTPIEPAFMVTGNIEVSNTSGQADIAYEVTGPHGAATIHVMAEKDAGRWIFHAVIAEFHHDGRQIDTAGAVASARMCPDA